MKRKDERNAQIFAERERGDLLKDIAARHGISLHRVTQLLTIERDRRGLPAAMEQRRSRAA